ncbi:MAG: thioredoxin fold domain-containing protein [Gammaproteobacteria bacterium]|nr:thioredoxin fold domain-containing protein [Gammaproteobacteria bacterium]MBQ0840075.1 thioredoxin fold domain-containing protein [Gammaproteobacteria bacterium]
MYKVLRYDANPRQPIRLKWLALVSIIIACVAQPLWAAEPSSSATEVSSERKARIMATLRSARPDLNYGDIEASPIPGIAMIQVENGPMLFVYNDGEFFFDGDLYQVGKGRFINLKEQALTAVRKDLLAEIPLDEMIVFSPTAEVKGVINVFTDVDCGYCRKLHKEVPELNAMGIEVRYMAFPRAGLGSASHHKIASAWCAEDPRTALTAMKNGEHVDTNFCDDNPVAKQYELGQQMGVNGTPAIVLADGSLLPGYRPAADMARVLGINNQQASTTR